MIKVERPGIGDIARGNGAVMRGVSLYFLSLNRGKKSVTIDLQSPGGKKIFLSLAAKADILVENFSVSTMEKLDLGYETLKQRNPALIYAAGSGFGQTGPYAHKPALDVTIQAMGGIMSITGEDGGPTGTCRGVLWRHLRRPISSRRFWPPCRNAMRAGGDSMSISVCWTARLPSRRMLLSVI